MQTAQHSFPPPRLLCCVYINTLCSQHILLPVQTLLSLETPSTFFLNLLLLCTPLSQCHVKMLSKIYLLLHLTVSRFLPKTGLQCLHRIL